MKFHFLTIMLCLLANDSSAQAAESFKAELCLYLNRCNTVEYEERCALVGMPVFESAIEISSCWNSNGSKQCTGEWKEAVTDGPMKFIGKVLVADTYRSDGTFERRLTIGVGPSGSISKIPPTEVTIRLQGSSLNASFELYSPSIIDPSSASDSTYYRAFLSIDPTAIH